MRALPPNPTLSPARSDTYGSSKTGAIKTRGGRTSGSGDMLVHKGGSITGHCRDDQENPAFVHATPANMPLPVLIAVPHAGCHYPDEISEQMRDPELCQLRLEDRRVDAIAVEIARMIGTGLLVAHAPRAIIDLNRASDDIDWGMIARPKGFDVSAFNEEGQAAGRTNARARSGLGIIPRRLPGFGEIWRKPLPHTELKRRIDYIHAPYHDHLEADLRRIRDVWGAALLVDLHSMPPLRRRSDQEQAPRIVLGDRYGASCEHTLASHAFSYLEQQGCPSAHNRPYSGGYVLDRHARPSKGIHGIQIEICRSAYLDGTLTNPTENVGVMAQMLAGLVRILGAETARLGSGTQFAQAAE